MNHQFMPHPNNPLSCKECTYPESKHGDNAVCDCCEKTGNLEPYLLGNSQALLTVECIARERALLETQVVINDALRQNGIQQFGVPPNGEDRILQYNAITRPYEKLIGDARKIDEQLHLNSDVFTAKTVAIEEIRRAIWADESIAPEKKFFELVKFCKERISTLQTVIFDLDARKMEAYSEQKAWHVHMNDYANKLRLDERQALRISDIHYDVKMPKPITPRAIKIKTPDKESKKDLRIAVSSFNNELKALGKNESIPEFMVQGIMVSKNWTIEQAINHLRRTIKEGLSES